MHGLHVLHRDLSTKNIFLSQSRGAVLGDLGLSKALAHSHTPGGDNQLATTMCGTPYYLSPEMLAGEPYGKPADVWALGVVLFELLTLQRPFAAPNMFVLMRKVSACQYDQAALERSPHPRELCALATRGALLHPEAGARLSLESLQARLDALDDAGHTLSPGPLPRGHRPSEPPSARTSAASSLNPSREASMRGGNLFANVAPQASRENSTRGGTLFANYEQYANAAPQT